MLTHHGRYLYLGKLGSSGSDPYSSMWWCSLYIFDENYVERKENKTPLGQKTEIEAILRVLKKNAMSSLERGVDEESEKASLQM